MKANELRIGNFYDHNGFVNEATPNTIEEVWIAERSWVKPIPLTKEWLLKFGFEWSIRHQAWHKLSFIFDLSERGVGGYYMHMVKKNNDIICPEIIYVHQLQNLYFALTGEELTFKSE